MNITDEELKEIQNVLKTGDYDNDNVKHKIQNYISEIRNIIGDKCNPNDSDIQELTQYRNVIINSFEYFKGRPPVEMIYYIRCIIEQNLFISYHQVPEYREIVKEYSPIVISARNTMIVMN